MEKLRNYIHELLDVQIHLDDVGLKDLGKLPFHLKEGFRLYHTTLLGRELILVHLKEELVSLHQVNKQFENFTKVLNTPLVLVMNDIPAIIRKRLVQKGINFIVPDKQMFLPSLLVDLRETFRKPKVQKDSLLPSAQVILIYRILNRNKKLEELPLKQLAQELKYTAMAVTKAAENLKQKDLCKIIGTKEKYILFDLPITELWHMAQPLLIDPVLKRVYVDDYPREKNIFLMHANTSALPEYSDMNPGQQEYRAIEKGLYYSLQKRGAFKNLNEYSGRFCLEVWKYNPIVLATGITEETNVDPISLYLSLRQTQDERIEMALEKIIAEYIW
jgi:hypothetical protein